MGKKRYQEDEIVADLLPVLNIMFLLIPALLLAMEFASMASINVSPPKNVMCACGLSRDSRSANSTASRAVASVMNLGCLPFSVSTILSSPYS